MTRVTLHPAGLGAGGRESTAARAELPMPCRVFCHPRPAVPLPARRGTLPAQKSRTESQRLAARGTWWGSGLLGHAVVHRTARRSGALVFHRQREAMLYLQIHEIEKAAAGLGLRLCPKCRASYQPCVAVKLCWDGQWDGRRNKWRVAHIAPKAYVVDESGVLLDPKYGVRFCDWESGRLVRVAGQSVFVSWLLVRLDEEFVKWLLRCHPELIAKPWTESVLNQLGIDLEAEIAMWLLSQ
jgi:hypothetical protein